LLSHLPLFVLRRHPRAKRRIPVFAFALALALALAFALALALALAFAFAFASALNSNCHPERSERTCCLPFFSRPSRIETITVDHRYLADRQSHQVKSPLSTIGAPEYK
jgi:hypothetical protein